MLDGCATSPVLARCFAGSGSSDLNLRQNGCDMNKLAILATGTVMLMLAGCGPRAQNQSDTANALAPVDDPMALNDSERTAVDNGAGADNAGAGNAGADKASNAGDRTSKDK
jgi:hypothetical protein